MLLPDIARRTPGDQPAAASGRGIVGVIGLTGEPESLRKYGELVCMTAEMMLEQSRLMHLLSPDSRLREELVMNLIQAEEEHPGADRWAQRLGVDLNQPRVVAMMK